MLCEQRRDLRPIRKIGMHEVEARLLPQQIEPRLLQRRIVEVVEIVEPDDMAAFGQQLTRDVKADEARGARDQYGLFRHHVPEHGPDERSSRASRRLFSRGVEAAAIEDWGPEQRRSAEKRQLQRNLPLRHRLHRGPSIFVGTFATPKSHR